jgi:hypothetical protein
MRYFFAAIIIFVSLNFLKAQDEERPCIPVRDVSDAQRAFVSGEKLVYKINYSWGMVKTDVGEATATLERVDDSLYGDHFHAIVEGHTYKFYDIFFKVRDFFESRFSTLNGRPYYFHRNISEGKYRMINHHYYHEDYTIDATVKRKSSAERDTLLVGRECTFDLVSLFYFARNLDFSKVEKGVEQPISFAIDDEVFELYYRFIGEEVKKIPDLGRYNTLKFAARVVAGEVFTGEEELIIWVSKDRNKVPLMFETPIIVGEVNGRLHSFENLRYPLSGKID